jgi:hypothetical protein
MTAGVLLFAGTPFGQARDRGLAELLLHRIRESKESLSKETIKLRCRRRTTGQRAWRSDNSTR